MNLRTPLALIVAATSVTLAACDEPANTTTGTGTTTTPSTTTRPTTPSTTTPSTTTPSTTTPARNDPAVPPDNTDKNERDRDGTTKTPMDQSESSADIKITAAIRRAIMDDDAMSTNAENCKIITDKAGVVTLRGPVNSQAEKDAIEAKAKAVAGVTRVDNQLEVKAPG